MVEKHIEINNHLQKNNIFEKKCANSIDIYGEIESIYKELKYEGDAPIIQCDAISGENLSWTATKWLLYTEDGKKIFESGKFTIDNTWEFDLNELGLSPNTKIILKAHSTDEASKSNVILQYTPSSKITAHFKLNGNAFNTHLNFLGVLMET